MSELHELMAQVSRRRFSLSGVWGHRVFLSVHVNVMSVSG